MAYKSTACRGPEDSRCRRCQISLQSPHENSIVVSPKHWPLLPLHSTRNILGTHFCYRLCQTQSHTAAGRIISMKNSYDTIENRNRDLPAQSTGPTLVPVMTFTETNLPYKDTIFKGHKIPTTGLMY
jgi:hypothetical protein